MHLNTAKKSGGSAACSDGVCEQRAQPFLGGSPCKERGLALRGGRSPTLWRVEWWQTLLISVLTPAVTACALLWQSRLNNDREDRRHRLEVADRSRDRRHAIRDHWREERRDAHVALLADFEAVAKELERQIMFGSEVGGIDDGLVEQVREHFASVQILSLADTRTAAEEAFAAFTHADGAAWGLVAIGVRRGETEAELRRGVRTAIADLKKATARYLDAVRKEIGTDEDDT
jgi:hypothetical protein